MKSLRQARFGPWFLAVAALAACSENAPPDPLHPSAAAAPAKSRAALARQAGRAEAAAALQGDNLRGIESQILRMENDVPGLGGMFYDTEAGRMVVYVNDRGQGERASAAVRAYLARTRAAQPEAERAYGSPVEVRVGEYAFSDLVGWSRILPRDLLEVEGWLAIDADERMNRVRITIEDESARRPVEAAVAANGVPAGAVHVEVGPRMYALATLRERLPRPVGGAVQVTNDAFGICSLGWTVARPDGGWGFLTAGHCTSFSIGGGSTGDTFYQTDDAGRFSRLASDAIGTVQINPAWNLQCADPNGGTYAGRCTDADAMFVSASPSAVTKKVATTASVGTSNQPGSLEITGWYTGIENPGPTTGPAVGYYAQKYGRTTGTTRGVVQGTCETHRICDQRDPNTGQCLREYLATCQGRCTGASVGGGDSGGPVTSVKAKRIGDPPPPLTPWGITIAGTNEDPNLGYCVNNCTMIFSTVERIRARLGQYFNFGTV